MMQTNSLISWLFLALWQYNPIITERNDILEQLLHDSDFVKCETKTEMHPPLKK